MDSDSHSDLDDDADPKESETNWAKFGKYVISFVVLLTMIGGVCLSVAGVILFRIAATVDWFSTPEYEKYRFIVASILPAIMNAVSSAALQIAYNRLAIILTSWENHRKQTQYDDALILKVFCFQFVNCYSSLFYIAFFQSVEYESGIFGMGSRYLDACGTDHNCMSQLSFQVLAMMFIKPLPKFIFDIILPIALKIFRRCCCCCCKKNNKAGPIPESDDPRAAFVAAEFHKEDLTRLDDFALFEYSEKIIQYGYVMLFAASFPLAPVMALITNIFDIRVDAWRLLKLCRRPVGFIAEDIGIWENIIVFLSMSGVATNAFLIAFTSKWGQKQTSNNQFWIIIGFQNICFFLKFLLEFFVPDVPSDLKTRMMLEKRWIKKKVKKCREEVEKSRAGNMRSEDDVLRPTSQKMGSTDANGNRPPSGLYASEATTKDRVQRLSEDGDNISTGDDGSAGAPRQRTKAKKNRKKEQDLDQDNLPPPPVKYLPPIERRVPPPRNQDNFE